MSQINIRCGLATVTSRGLYFKGRYYSNATLVKLQWFLLADQQGAWQIPILYNASDNTHVLLFDLTHFELATTMDNDIKLDPSIIERYQAEIRRLKTLWSLNRLE